MVDETEFDIMDAEDAEDAREQELNRVAGDDEVALRAGDRHQTTPRSARVFRRTHRARLCPSASTWSRG